jgi:hypothetical protein
VSGASVAYEINKDLLSRARVLSRLYWRRNLTLDPRGPGAVTLSDAA